MVVEHTEDSLVADEAWARSRRENWHEIWS